LIQNLDWTFIFQARCMAKSERTACYARKKEGKKGPKV
jgi:hypothetical protein